MTRRTQRKAQIGVGTLTALGILPGLTVSPGWLALTLLVGCGLTFAGISGFCGMTPLLDCAPWNGAPAR